MESEKKLPELLDMRQLNKLAGVVDNVTCGARIVQKPIAFEHKNGGISILLVILVFVIAFAIFMILTKWLQGKRSD